MNRRSKSPLLAPAHGLLHLVTASLQLPQLKRLTYCLAPDLRQLRAKSQAAVTIASLNLFQNRDRLIKTLHLTNKLLFL
jgi:hypothetical protein